MEGAGEDAFRKCGSKSARFQGTDLAATNTILACAKHFAGYGFAESGRIIIQLM
jgi:beta-glucosidase